MRKKIPKLNIEQFEVPENLHLISIIEYKRQEFVCIIDNITPSEVRAFVIERSHPESLTIPELISNAIYWFYHKSNDHQLSIYLSSKGLTAKVNPLYQIFDIKGISRVVGNAFEFSKLSVSKVKKRRVLPISETIEIKFKKSTPAE